MQNLERQGEVRPGVIYTTKLVSSGVCCLSHVAPRAPQCLKASAMGQSAGMWTPTPLVRTWITIPYPSRAAFLTSLLLPHTCKKSVHHPRELLTIHLRNDIKKKKKTSHPPFLIINVLWLSAHKFYQLSPYPRASTIRKVIPALPGADTSLR